MQRRMRGWLSLALCVLAVAAFYALLQLRGITCPIKHLTGISCPGCGMTRACLAALRLEFAAAFAYHPLWVAVLPTAVAGLLLYRKRRWTALRWLLVGSVVALLSVYAWRMAFDRGDVVTFAPAQGMIGRLLHTLLHRLP